MKWLKTAENGWKLLKIAGDGYTAKIGWNGWKRMEMLEIAGMAED